MPLSFSVNHLKTWQHCTRKFELALVRKLQWPSDPKNFRLGKGVHQLLDFQAKELPLDQIIAAADLDIVLLWKGLDQSKWGRQPVIASEWGFSLCVPPPPAENSLSATTTATDVWIYGRIDRIIEDPDMPGQWAIIDWKTGTRIPEALQEDWQTRIYLYAVTLAQGDLGLSRGAEPLSPEKLSMVYVHVVNGQVEVARVPYSQAMHEETHQRLHQTFEAIETAKRTQQFPLPAQCPDKHCPYRTVCGIQSQATSVDTVEQTPPSGTSTSVWDNLPLLEPDEALLF